HHRVHALHGHDRESASPRAHDEPRSHVGIGVALQLLDDTAGRPPHLESLTAGKPVAGHRTLALETSHGHGFGFPPRVPGQTRTTIGRCAFEPRFSSNSASRSRFRSSSWRTRGPARCSSGSSRAGSATPTYTPRPAPTPRATRPPSSGTKGPASSNGSAKASCRFDRATTS